MPIAHIPAGDIFYEQFGEGPPLLLMLPQSVGPEGIQPFIDGLAASFAVIRYDQRGTGLSAAPPNLGAVSIRDRAAEAVDLLDFLGIAQASLFCHSTGCGIGLALAAARPGYVAKIVLAAPWEYGDKYLTGMQNLRISAARALDAEAYARFNASLLFPPDYRRAHEQGFSQQAKAASLQDASQIADKLNAILAFDSRVLAPEINHQTLIMTAADDQLMPAWFGRSIAETMPNATFMELTGGGHMLPETRTDEVVGLVQSFASTA